MNSNSSLLNELAGFAKRPPNQKVSEFARQERRLSQETSAASGRWASVPYQVEMQDIFNDPKVKMAVFMTSTQIGKTEILKNIIAYTIAYSSGPTTFMLPSESIATDYSKAQIAPLIRDTPILAAKIPSSRKDGNTHLHKSWPGGSLRLVGSQSADKLSSFPSPRLLIDELDRCQRVTRNSAGIVEGSPVDLFLERSKNWPNRFAIFTSTPTIEGASAIEQWWLKSDQRFPHIACPHCGYYQFLEWENFEWDGRNEPEKPQDPDTICYRCKSCQQTFKDQTRNQWLKTVKWIKQNPGSDIAGFHLNAFYSPWSSWSELLQKYIDAGSNQVKRMVFWNTTLGLPFSLDAVKSPEWQTLYNRVHWYERYQVPAKIKVLLAAIDVQMDRFEISIIGFNKTERFVITHEVVVGNTANVEDECFHELDELLDKEWITTDGLRLKVHRAMIDAHYNTYTIGQYVQSRKRLIPVTGMDTNWKHELLPSRPMDIKRNGKYLKTGKRRWPIGVSLFKVNIYAALKLEPNQDGTYPTGYIHFPKGMTEEYFKQLTGEVCKLEQDARGKTKMVFEKQHEAVEALDCMVYALAGFKICNLHLKSDEWWQHFHGD